MAKVSIKSEKITPFGGIYFTNKAFNALSLGKIINETLGMRCLTYNGYQWDEIISALFDVFLCGGDCVEDLNRSECHLREYPNARIPTSHTVGRAIKELACKNIQYKSRTDNVFQFNANPKLNDLLMKLNMAMGLFRCGQYVYRCIITNDWDSSEKSIIETYNKRGARECDFARLNNDFGWKHLPCSFMNENTVFMILTAICMNFLSFFLGRIADVFTKLTPTSRVKTFVFNFTAVCAKWTRTARRWCLNLYTDMPYDKISFG